MAVGAVWCELLSDSHSLFGGNLQGKTRVRRCLFIKSQQRSRGFPLVPQKLPWKAEQGIFAPEQGIRSPYPDRTGKISPVLDSDHLAID